MADEMGSQTALVIRVGMPGQPTFQLRKGEDGLSVFVPESVDPPLTEEEILECFRPGSLLIAFSFTEIQDRGLKLIAIEGADVLPDRLRKAHHEIRKGSQTSRDEFKRLLKELEP